jgi:hypothetical protein
MTSHVYFLLGSMKNPGIGEGAKLKSSAKTEIKPRTMKN